MAKVSLNLVFSDIGKHCESLHRMHFPGCNHEPSLRNLSSLRFVRIAPNRGLSCSPGHLGAPVPAMGLQRIITSHSFQYVRRKIAVFSGRDRFTSIDLVTPSSFKFIFVASSGLDSKKSGSFLVSFQLGERFSPAE